MSLFTIIYIAVALGVSLFYGFFGVIIFSGKKYYNSLTKMQKVRKFIIFFVPTILGFSLLYYLINKVLYCMTTEPKQYNLISVTDVLLLIIALMGIAGYLPNVIYRITRGINKIVEKIASSLTK